MIDRDGVIQQMGDNWDPFLAYNLKCARTPSVKAAMRTLMKEIGVPRIPNEDLERITVQTSLIWGRDDRANRLRIAEKASAHYGWPLHVIDDAGDDPKLERPDAFLDALDRALSSRTSEEEKSS
jgi:pimeloyl-ACP methyl ester carboxylesterase